MPSGYQRSADPLLSENPYTNGIAPGRIYLTGIVFNTDTTSGYGPSGVVVWRSDDGGVSWYQPQFVESTSNPDLFLDKPAITVSWYSGTRGYVYVAYIRINRGAPDELVVARSTNGGETFGTPIVVATGDGIQGPQVLADYYHGNVYVLWADRTLEAIQMSTSNDYGQTWTPPEEVATGDIMGGGKKEWLKGGVRAGTLPMARFNWIANRICVVWHEREQPGTNLTDVYYTAKGPSGWQAKVMVNDNQVRDQFMPALDFDVSGRIKVVFYDRRDDASNFRYHLYTAYITSNGTLVRANGRLSTFSSDPRLYTSHTGFAGFIGDYQDIWDHQYSFGEHYISSWVGIPSVGDIYLTAMSPN